jgi:hypothetical protein
MADSRGDARVRVFLPKCWFDAEKCARGIEIGHPAIGAMTITMSSAMRWKAACASFKVAAEHNWQASRYESRADTSR